MIYLLFGSDDFSKKEFLNELAVKSKATAVSLFEDSTPDIIVSASRGGGLFGGKEIVKVYGYLGLHLDSTEGLIARLESSSNDVVFIEESLDKRKSESKKLLADKRIKALTFEIPAGDDFKKWVQVHSKERGVKFGRGAGELFIQRLGESYSLWQADSELHKLAVYSQGKEISVQDVESLVSENIDEDVFKLTNAIGDKNRSLSMKFLTDYMDRLAGLDDKSKIISLSALLADQFRNVLMIQGFLSDRLSDNKISSLTGFSPGRLFVMKKLSSRFAAEKVREVLFKMEALDEELKTSAAPSGLQFLMIIESALR